MLIAKPINTLLYKILSAFITIVFLPATENPLYATDFETRQGTQWTPYMEWKMNDVSYKGNPFDVRAQATFIHQKSGNTITTGMFYNGQDNWKFRFTGTKTGRWVFSTSSSNDDLDGGLGVKPYRKISREARKGKKAEHAEKK